MENSIFEELLPSYYRNYFPGGLWCRWVAAGCNPQPLSHRELSFTLAQDIYIRYLSVRALPDLKALLQKKCPFKIDIGAVYDSEPSMTKQGATVLSRELVFDIDLTDYDDIRTCCQGAEICQKCWKFMIIACQILDCALKEDFGFSSILWVYSGRRGIHGWVSCSEARLLSSIARSAVADYLAVVTGGESQVKKVHLNSDSLHTSIKRAHKIITAIFDEILEDQQFISSAEGLAKFLKLIPDDVLASQVRETLSTLPSDSTLRWKAFLEVYKSYWKEHNKSRQIKYLVEEIQLQWCYPRLDINVSKGLNHLLKAPFSVHPKTEKVCVVFRNTDVSTFDTNKVPTLSDLLDEQSPNHAQARAQMQESVSIFQTHVFALEKEEAKRKRTAG